MKFIPAEWLGELKTLNFTGTYSIDGLHAILLREECLWVIFKISNKVDSHLLVAFLDVSNVEDIKNKYASFKDNTSWGRVVLYGEFVVSETLSLKLETDEELLKTSDINIIGVSKSKKLDEVNEGLSRKLTDWITANNEIKRRKLTGSDVNLIPSIFNEFEFFKNGCKLNLHVEKRLTNDFMNLMSSNLLIFNLIEDTTIWVTGNILPGTHICMGHSYVLESGNKMYTVDDVLDNN